MEYKRHEAFRYIFNSPLESTMKIIRINGRDVESTAGAVEIHDISLNGAKFACPLNLHPEHEVYVQISFCLNEKPLDFLGHIVWKKTSGKQYFYGLEFQNKKYDKEQLLSELKVYARRHMGASSK